MKEKLHVALDESYLDLTNIHSKLQRHTVFESEILSNNERFVQVTLSRCLGGLWDPKIYY